MLVIEHHVVRLDVAMNHAPAMRVIQRAAQLAQDFSGFCQRGQLVHVLRCRMQAFRQCPAGQQTHDHIAHAVGRRTIVIDRDDVRVFQRSSSFCFAGEAFQIAGLPCQQHGDDFNRHIAVQIGLVRLINRAHPSQTEQFCQAIFAKCFASEIFDAHVVPLSPR